MDYRSITELPGDYGTHEQLVRLSQRYYWAAEYCKGKDVLEAGCGSGFGLGYLSGEAKSLVAGDIDQEILKIPCSYYGGRIDIRSFDAQALPVADRSVDVVILFEAIYYLPDPEQFIKECKRVLRPTGKILIATANKDLFDFHPSPFSRQYYGVMELKDLFEKHTFSVEAFGGTPYSSSSGWQKLLRPVKKLAVATGIMPKSKAGKAIFKRIVFGRQYLIPNEVSIGLVPFVRPKAISNSRPDKDHKVLYFCATINH